MNQKKVTPVLVILLAWLIALSLAWLIIVKISVLFNR